MRKVNQAITIAILSVVLLSLIGAANPKEQKFVPLFPNPGVPKGWVVREWNDLSKPVDGVEWAVESDVLHSGMKRGTWLVSEKEYGDFILECEIKLTEKGNSGIALRAPMKDDPAFVGMEMQCADFRYNTDAKPFELTGAIYRAIEPKKQVYKPTDWNKFHIELRGTHLKATLNGELIQDIDLTTLDKPTKRHDGSDAIPVKDRPLKGHIGFQHLSRDDEPVMVRNARIKEL